MTILPVLHIEDENWYVWVWKVIICDMQDISKRWRAFMRMNA